MPNWFTHRRSASPDRPTVELTAEERAAFDALARVYGRPRRGLAERARRIAARAGWRTGLVLWAFGAIWIVLALTSGVLMSALGIAPYVAGLSLVLRHPRFRRRVRALHRVLLPAPRSPR